jgi:signal transduction histidine kinase
MQRQHSIRTRIYKLFAGFTLVLCLIYSALLLLYSWTVEDNVFNRIVSTEARYIEERYSETGEIAHPRSYFLTLYRNWQELPSYIYGQHIKEPNRIEFKTDTGGTIHLRPIKLGTKTYILAGDISAFEVGPDYLPFITVTLFIILIAFSIMAVGLAWPIARAASAPLVDLKRTIETGKNSPLPNGFSREFPNNEVGYLAREIENSMADLKAMLKREQDFTRDVSHELRTPLTILKNLTAQKTPASDSQLLHTQQMANAIADMEEIISTLMALARSESSEITPIRLLASIEDCIIAHPAFRDGNAFDLQLEIPSETIVLGNPSLLQILINNLLSNAVNHGTQRQLKIYIEGHSLVFENPTSGSKRQGEVSINQPHQGLGVGLHLIKRICLILKWNVTTDEGATCFTVRLAYRHPDSIPAFT